jgi:hypothetical protein
LWSRRKRESFELIVHHIEIAFVRFPAGRVPVEEARAQRDLLEDLFELGQELLELVVEGDCILSPGLATELLANFLDRFINLFAIEFLFELVLRYWFKAGVLRVSRKAASKPTPVKTLTYLHVISDRVQFVGDCRRHGRHFGRERAVAGL